MTERKECMVGIAIALRDLSLLAYGDEIHEYTLFKEHMGLDSLDMLEVRDKLEGMLKCQLPTHEFERICSVGELIDYLLHRKLPQ